MDGRQSMLLTKYKVQDLVENAKIDLDELEKRASITEIDESGVTLVYTAIEMLKENIADEVGEIVIIDDDNLYQVEMCASSRPPSLSWSDWSSLDNAIDEYDRIRTSTLMRKDVESSGIEVRLWSYNKRKQQITLIRVDRG